MGTPPRKPLEDKPEQRSLKHYCLSAAGTFGILLLIYICLFPVAAVFSLVFHLFDMLLWYQAAFFLGIMIAACFIPIFYTQAVWKGGISSLTLIITALIGRNILQYSLTPRWTHLLLYLLFGLMFLWVTLDEREDTGDTKVFPLRTAVRRVSALGSCISFIIAGMYVLQESTAMEFITMDYNIASIVLMILWVATRAIRDTFVKKSMKGEAEA